VADNDLLVGVLDLALVRGRQSGCSRGRLPADGPRGGRREGVVDAVAKSAARTVGSSPARELTRGVLGSLLGGRRR
jgi:uncharacterized protein